jgi:hypothetical protein
MPAVTRSRSFSEALLGGALSGTIATIAMSTVMVVGARLGLMGRQPPTVVTQTALREVGVQRPAAKASVLAPFAHLAFGGAAGALYGLIRARIRSIPGLVLGPAFGLGVWTISYGGWIPAAGILPAPQEDQPGRPIVMIAAHLVYGGVLGALED